MLLFFLSAVATVTAAPSGTARSVLLLLLVVVVVLLPLPSIELELLLAKLLLSSENFCSGTLLVAVLIAVVAGVDAKPPIQPARSSDCASS